MASASAPASELAVQLPAPASSIAEAPPPASTAEEAVDPSAGAVILEDPGPALLVLLVLVRRVQASFLTVVVLLIFIYRRLCSGFSINTSIFEVVALRLVSFSPCLLCLSHASIFHFLISACCTLLSPFCFLVIFRRYFVCTYSYMGSDTTMYEVLLYLLYPAYECVACLVLWN